MGTKSLSCVQSEGVSQICSSQPDQICGSSKSKSLEKNSTTNKKNGTEGGRANALSSAPMSTKSCISYSYGNPKQAMLAYLKDLKIILRKDVPRAKLLEIPGAELALLAQLKIIEQFEVWINHNLHSHYHRLP